MNSNKLASIVAALPLLVACLFCGTVISPVSAQSSCITVRTIEGLSANIRNEPSSTSPTSRIVGSLKFENGTRQSCEQSGGWYRIPEGWVSSTYLQGGVSRVLVATISPTRTPTSPTRTPIPSPSRMPTITPAIAGLASVTPAPTKNPEGVYVTGENGQLIINAYCSQACELELTITNLDQPTDRRR